MRGRMRGGMRWDAVKLNPILWPTSKVLSSGTLVVDVAADDVWPSLFNFSCNFLAISASDSIWFGWLLGLYESGSLTRLATLFREGYRLLDISQYFLAYCMDIFSILRMNEFFLLINMFCAYMFIFVISILRGTYLLAAFVIYVAYYF